MKDAETCSRKMVYKDRTEAMMARRKNSSTAEPYRCLTCGRWHLGHPTGHDLKASFRGRRREGKWSRMATLRALGLSDASPEPGAA